MRCTKYFWRSTIGPLGLTMAHRHGLQALVCSILMTEGRTVPACLYGTA